MLTHSWLRSQLWALLPERFAALAEAVAAGGLQAAPVSPRTSRSSGAVAVVPIRGFIAPRSSPMLSWFGGTGVDQVVAEVRRAVADSSVQAVVLDVDSPGGEVAGVPEAASAIRSLRGVKPIVASCNTLCASAAYWLASQADRVVASPSGLVGSIGVFAGHLDESRALDAAGLTVTLIHYGERKVDAASTSPLSDRARQDIQNRVDQAGRMFEQDVASGRRVSLATVQARFGRGGIFTAADAKAAGLVDEVGTFEQAVGKALKLPSASLARRTAELERDLHRLNAGFSIRETEGWARRETERLQRYVDGFKA